MDATLPRVLSVVLLVSALILGALFVFRGGITADSASRNKLVGSWHSVRQPVHNLVLESDGAYARDEETGTWAVEDGSLLLQSGNNNVYLRFLFQPPADKSAPRGVDISGERYEETIAPPKK